jgi:hypothetical protein
MTQTPSEFIHERQQVEANGLIEKAAEHLEKRWEHLGRPLDPEEVSPENMYRVAENLVGGGIAAKGFKQILKRSAQEFAKKRAAKQATKEAALYATFPEPVKKVMAALKRARPTRKAQEAIYTKERGERFAKFEEVGEKTFGEAGFHAQLREFGGKYSKVEFESIRGVGQKDIDSLFEMIKHSKKIVGYDKVTAGRGLAKLFGEYGGSVPQGKELELLGEIFPREFVKTLLKKRSLWARSKEAGLQLVNIPRSLMASFDFSAPLRQGIFLGAGHPIKFAKAFVKMFKQFGSEEVFQAAQKSIAERPTYKLMNEAKLALTSMGRELGVREERFMTQWADIIPGVRASGRAYVGFLNKLRADVFDDLVEKATKAGLEPHKNMDLTKKIAEFVNRGSGRGRLGGLENSAVELTALFFSPRLTASRIQLLNPGYYITADPFVRKEALKSLFALSAAGATVLGLASAGGAKVGTDRRSADFGKIIVGNTRIDMFGGFQQYIRVANQLQSGELVSSVTGKVTTLGKGYRPLSRKDILYRFGEGKLSPVMSFALRMMEGQDLTGQPLEVGKEIGQRFVPMVIQDVYDIAKEDPELLPVSVLGVFGVGLQTYGGRMPPSSQGIQGIKAGAAPYKGY